MLTYSLIENDGEQSLLVMVPGRDPIVVAGDHPYFDAILAGARVGDEDVYELADLGKTAASRFQKLTTMTRSGGGDSAVSPMMTPNSWKPCPPSIGSPPSSISRALLSARIEMRSPGLKMSRRPASNVSPAMSISPATM